MITKLKNHSALAVQLKGHVCSFIEESKKFVFELNDALAKGLPHEFRVMEDLVNIFQNPNIGGDTKLSYVYRSVRVTYNNQDIWLAVTLSGEIIFNPGFTVSKTPPQRMQLRFSQINRLKDLDQKYHPFYKKYRKERLKVMSSKKFNQILPEIIEFLKLE